MCGLYCCHHCLSQESGGTGNEYMRHSEHQCPVLDMNFSFRRLTKGNCDTTKWLWRTTRKTEYGRNRMTPPYHSRTRIKAIHRSKTYWQRPVAFLCTHKLTVREAVNNVWFVMNRKNDKDIKSITKRSISHTEYGFFKSNVEGATRTNMPYLVQKTLIQQQQYTTWDLPNTEKNVLETNWFRAPDQGRSRWVQPEKHWQSQAQTSQEAKTQTWWWYNDRWEKRHCCGICYLEEISHVLFHAALLNCSCTNKRENHHKKKQNWSWVTYKGW